jgi:hypothetical protein
MVRLVKCSRHIQDRQSDLFNTSSKANNLHLAKVVEQRSDQIFSHSASNEDSEFCMGEAFGELDKLVRQSTTATDHMFLMTNVLQVYVNDCLRCHHSITETLLKMERCASYSEARDYAFLLTVSGLTPERRLRLVIGDKNLSLKHSDAIRCEGR